MYNVRVRRQSHAPNLKDILEPHVAQYKGVTLQISKVPSLVVEINAVLELHKMIGISRKEFQADSAACFAFPLAVCASFACFRAWLILNPTSSFIFFSNPSSVTSSNTKVPKWPCLHL
jgi:hypothetical protein